MRPLLTRFCVVYSLEVGVISLCIASILVSGGLICNNQFKLPVQIRDWRNASIYSEGQLDVLKLNVNIATWVLVGDILCTLLMLLPASMTDIQAPWKERNCRRKILIPCIVGKILCILHGTAAFVWITWKFHHDCPEIIGILLALALYVLLGWYVVVVVLSYYLHLGMRMTFHKLRHSKSDSTQRSQESQFHFQKGEVEESDRGRSMFKDEKNGNRRPGRAVDQRLGDGDDDAGKSAELKGHEEYKTSQRKLYEQNERKPERRSHSSQEALDRRSRGSKEKLESNGIDEREEQYKKLMKRSRGSLDSVDEDDDGGHVANDNDHGGGGERYRRDRTDNGRERKRENITQVGPDQIEYHVSEREETDGGGKRRYYYKRDKRDPYERSEADRHLLEMQRKPKASASRGRRESDDSAGSIGRLRSPPKQAPAHHQSDDSYEDVRNDPYRQRKPERNDPYNRPPRSNEYQGPQRILPPYQPYHRGSDNSLDRIRSPPAYKPSPRMSDSSHDSYDRVRPQTRRDYRPQYYDPPRRYYDEEPERQAEQFYDDYEHEQSQPGNTRPDTTHRAYEHDNDDDDDDDYIEDEYDQAPPYEYRRDDQDGYVSSEV